MNLQALGTQPLLSQPVLRKDKMIKNKHIVAIDFAVLAVTLVLLAVFVGYARPLVIAPLDGFVTSDSNVLFTFENGELILIDDNLEFSSPQEFYVEDNLVISLKPGVYYWKVSGLSDSEVRKLTIESLIELKVVSNYEGFDIVNSGNEILEVDIYEGDNFVESIELAPSNQNSVLGNKFIGRKNA